MPTIVRLQERIAALMECGVSLDEVEADVIGRSGVDADRKAALWLYAWSFVDGREQRNEATRYLLSVGAFETS